jgi:putative redox protein
MEITLTRVNDRVHFVGRNPEGNEIHIDGSPSVGGEEAGFRPMQLLLAALAGCASTDLSDILRKQRAGLEQLEIVASGERADAVPAPFTAIHLHFKLYGGVDRAKAERALDLAVNKYCSVGEMVRKAAPITYDYEILPAAARRPAGHA